MDRLSIIIPIAQTQVLILSQPRSVGWSLIYTALPSITIPVSTCYLQRPMCTVHRLSSTADKNVFLYKQLTYYFDVCVVHFKMFLLWMIVPVLRLDDYIYKCSTCIRLFSFLKCLPSEYRSIFVLQIAIQRGDVYSSLIPGAPLFRGGKLIVRIREKMGNWTNKRPTSQSGYFYLSLPNIVSSGLLLGNTLIVI